MGKLKHKFVFVIGDGPNAGVSSGTWVIWTSHEDTYVTASHLGNK